jgi:hypothetical protein
MACRNAKAVPIAGEAMTPAELEQKVIEAARVWCDATLEANAHSVDDVSEVIRSYGAFLAALRELTSETDRLNGLLNTPELESFSRGVSLEAAHQIERWGTNHDKGKEPQDWYWLLAYLSGKALRAHCDGDREKALHHTISSGAVLANWHAHIKLGVSKMQPGSVSAAELGELIKRVPE